MTFRNKILAPFFLISFVWSSSALALPEDKTKPIELEANQAKLNNQSGLAEYTGNVVITQGTAKLEADRVILHSENNQIKRMEAFGAPAKYQQILNAGEQPTYIEGKTLDLKVDQELIEITESGAIYQGNDRLTGEKIIYSLKTGELKAGEHNTDQTQQNSDTRVKMIFHPKSIKETSTQAPKTTPQ